MHRRVLALLCFCLLAAFAPALAVPVDESRQSFLQVAQEPDNNVFKPKVAPAPKKSIQGRIKMNGSFFKTVCSCADASENNVSNTTSLCFAPSKLRVHQENVNYQLGLTKEELHAILGNARTMVMLDVDKTSFADVDGRDSNRILGTPGGDFVEFLNGLSAYQRVMGVNFTQDQVDKLLLGWLTWPERAPNPPMYLNTDEAALSHLEKHLHVDGRVGNVVGLDLENPRQEYKDELLKDLKKPANQGCYVLKAVLDNPTRFSVNPDLAPALIEAYFKILWEDASMPKKRVNLVVLDGEPKEAAWINFRGNPHCEAEHKAPSFTPEFEIPAAVGTNKITASVFVNHPHAVEALREKLARYFALKSGHVDYKDLFHRINRQGNRVMENYAASHNVPFYSVTVE